MTVHSEHVLAGLLLVALAGLGLPGCGGSIVKTGETGPNGDAGEGGAAGRGGKGGTTGGGATGAGAAGAGLASGTGGSLGGTCAVDPNDDDVDRDGYKRDVDCDDLQNRVNPGAFDVPGNGVDDDCDGGVDNGPGIACDDANDIIPLDATEPEALARAMGLCGRPLVGDPSRRWGISSVQLWGLESPWTASRDHLQHGVQTAIGGFVPKQGRSMLMLTTGRARLGSQPGGVDGYPSLESPYGEALPNGFPENDPICLAAANDPDITAWNPIALHLSIRAPTNAARFKWSARAISPENPNQLVCAGENSLLAAFKESYTGSPFAKNVALLPDGSLFSADHLPWTYCYPVSFTEGGRAYDFPCVDGDDSLSIAPPWRASATAWSDFEVNVVPGQEFDFTLIVWAHGSMGYGAFGVLLDDFQWIASPASSPVCGP